MSWQHWVLVALYGFGFIAGIVEKRVSSGVVRMMGSVIGVMLLVWGQR